MIIIKTIKLLTASFIYMIHKINAFIYHVFLDSISSCPIDSECIPIKTCAPIISQLSLAKETSDIERKRKIISQVREKVCGDRKDRLICCPQATTDVVGRSPGNDNKYY